MRLTNRTDYALRIVMVLGASGRRHTVPALAEAFGVSVHHLTKVVQALQGQGWVKTIAGRAGGVELTDSACMITAGDVVRAMEPDLALVECLQPDGRCPLQQPCQLAGILMRARDAFLAELDSMTISDLFVAQEAELLRAVPTLVSVSGRTP